MDFRKTLKYLFLTGALSGCSFLTFAQGAYVKIGGGYNVGIGSQTSANVTTNIINDPVNGSKITEKAQTVKLNYGKGFSGSVAAGYMFCDRFGAELEATYLAGGKNKSFTKLTFGSNPNETRLRKYNSYAQMLLLQPAFVLSAGLTGPVNVYGKFGVTAARGTIFYDRYSKDETGERIIEAQYSGGWGFGLLGALGVTYKLNEKLDLFSEIKMSNLSYSPRFYTVKKETLNGQDLTPHPQSFEFVNSYSTTYPASGEQLKYTKEAFPCGSVGLNIGLKYNF